MEVAGPLGTPLGLAQRKRASPRGVPPIPPRIRVFSNESTLSMKWPNYGSYSFSISPSNEYSGLTSFRIDCVQETRVATREESGVLGFPSSPRGEAIFRCARPSGVPRGPATSTGSLASQRHPGKFPKVPGRRRGWCPLPGSLLLKSLESPIACMNDF